jgi:hypothetical protein
MDTGDFLSQGGTAEVRAWPPPPFIAKAKNEWSYTSTLPSCFHGMHRGNFNFTGYDNKTK